MTQETQPVVAPKPVTPAAKPPPYVDHALADGRVRVVQTDPASGRILCVSSIHYGSAASHLAAVPNTAVLSAGDAGRLDGTLNWTYTGGVLAKASAPVVPVERLRAGGCAKVDARAETARSQWITPGVGQSLEYQETAAEAARAVAAPDPLLAAYYPFLAADQEAHSATAPAPTLRQVAQAVMARHTAWLAAAAVIKRVRLTAKRQIATATTQAQIDAILAGVAWPIPPATATEG